MDAVEARVGVGVFRRRLHFVDLDARTLKLGDREYHFARCGAVTVLDTDNTHPAWVWCPGCVWPDEVAA